MPTPEGGATNFRGVIKGGRFFFDFVIFFPNVLKRHFLLFLRHFGHIYFFCLRGGENFSRRREGGRNIFAASLRGGEIFLHVDYFGFLRENKGTRKKYFAQIR